MCSFVFLSFLFVSPFVFSLSLSLALSFVVFGGFSASLSPLTLPLFIAMLKLQLACVVVFSLSLSRFASLVKF